MKSMKTLPRDRSSRYKQYTLYQVEQDEGDFLNNLDELIQYHLSNVDIDGVYETQVPLEFRVILECGAFVRLNSKRIDKSESALNRTYTISELIPESSKRAVNFPDINKILVYYTHTNNRHFIAVYIPKVSISTFTVSEGKLNKDINSVELKFKKVLIENNAEEDVSFTKFDYKHHTNLYDVFSTIDGILKEYKSKNKQAFITVIHTNVPIEKIVSYGLVCLNGEIPFMVNLPSQKENNFPALDWKYYATEKFCKRCYKLDSWFSEKVNFSNYAGIPLGNLKPDTAIQIIDVHYSRVLQNQNHVLWYSDTTLPDLGGNEDADYRRFFDQFDSNAEMSYPGFYRSYTVEMNISLLCINAILQSDQLYEFINLKTDKKDEKDVENARLDNKMTDDIESFESCTSSFLKLKQVVAQWLDDIKKENWFADVLLSHLYRWLSSGEAKLYDPQLFNFVNNLMQKCFTELIKKFKALGATLVFASFNKIIIETKKQDITQATNYINFIVDTIMKEDMFKYLRLSTVQEWKVLLFKDRFNYGGIQYDADSPNEKELVTCQFDLKNHLPENVSKMFIATVADFIFKNYRHWSEKKESTSRKYESTEDVNMHLSSLVNAQPRSMEDDDPYIGRYAACHGAEQMTKIQEIMEDEDIHFARKLIREDITRKLFAMIDEINNRKTYVEMKLVDAERHPDRYSDQKYQELQEELDNWNFVPQLGSYLEQNKPTLELVNFVCEIFSIDENLRNAATVLRRGCLRKMSQKEFSDESVYLEPSLELILPQTTCDKCQTSRNLDICKEYSYEKESWLCNECEKPLNKTFIEKKLIDLLNARLIAYQIQDIECKKCKMIKNTILGTLCHCTGRFKNTHCDIELDKLQNKNLLNQHSDIKILLRLLQNIGRIQEMKLLQSVAESKLRVV